MSLQEAFVQLRNDKDLARRFTEDPEGVLKQMGVDTSTVTIRQTGPAPYHKLQAIPEASLDIATCVSIGCIACVSIG